MSDEAVLAVSDLRTHFHTRAGAVRAVDGISFSLRPGQILGLVGESGSGKSVTGFSLIGLIDPPGRVVGGSVRFEGRELIGLPKDEPRRLRGARIAMIFQDPMMTLNPVLRIGTQMVETVLAHDDGASRTLARSRACEALGKVGIASPEERLDAYPHQLSGGMRQRVATAIALLHRPAVIIADEPTTALDVTIQSQILFEMQRLCRGHGTALIWISHDLAVVSGLADEVAVMYAGRIVEHGPVGAVITAPLHPYAHGLIASAPSRNRRGIRLAQIPGMVPSLLELPPGCSFRNRCERAAPLCTTDPPVAEVSPGGGRLVRCFYPVTPEVAA